MPTPPSDDVYMRLDLSFVAAAETSLFSGLLPCHVLSVRFWDLATVLASVARAGPCLSGTLLPPLRDAWSHLMIREAYFRRKMRRDLGGFDRLLATLREGVLACQAWPTSQACVSYVRARR